MLRYYIIKFMLRYYIIMERMVKLRVLCEKMFGIIYFVLFFKLYITFVRNNGIENV